MANPYIASSITGCNSPAVGADKDTYTGIFDTHAQAVDGHDHTTGKGLPIPTAGIDDGAVTTAKLDDGAVTTTKIATDGVETANIKNLNVTLAKLAAEVLATFIPTGVIIPYAGSGAAPTGYLLCEGQSLLRADYPTLYSVIGTSHGTADLLHFNLPDYRGRFLRGLDGTAGLDPDKAARTAMATGGATGNVVGTIQGSQFGTHDHGGGNHSHQGNANDAGATGLNNKYPVNGGDGGGVHPLVANAIQNSGAIISAAGGNETRPVNATVQYLIKT